jgi:hypothetical protein
MKRVSRLGPPGFDRFRLGGMAETSASFAGGDPGVEIFGIIAHRAVS